MRKREFTVYLDEGDSAALTKLAAKTGLRKAEVVRLLVRDAVASRTLSFAVKKPRTIEERGRLGRKYVEKILTGRPPVAHPGRRWKKCRFLRSVKYGKYRCSSEEVYPKCFAGCKAYFSNVTKS
jgi:hypothetical protein